MSKEIQIRIGRTIQELYDCRILIDEEKEPYCLICAADIGKIIGINNIHCSLLHFDKILIKCETNGGEQKLSFITYDGLKRLLSKSRKLLVIDFCNKMDIDISSKVYTCIEADTLKYIMMLFVVRKCYINIILNHI